MKFVKERSSSKGRSSCSRAERRDGKKGVRDRVVGLFNAWNGENDDEQGGGMKGGGGRCAGGRGEEERRGLLGNAYGYVEGFGGRNAGQGYSDGASEGKGVSASSGRMELRGEDCEGQCGRRRSGD